MSFDATLRHHCTLLVIFETGLQRFGVLSAENGQIVAMVSTKQARRNNSTTAARRRQTDTKRVLFAKDLGKNMGGYGSGRWAWHSKKDTVDDSRLLEIKRLVEEGTIKPDTFASGRWIWSNRLTGEERASIGYRVSTQTDRGIMRLQYTVTMHNKSLDYPVRLQTTRPNFGGIRWYFTCPLVVSGNKCERRVSKLYLPPSSHYFGCRHCHDLTYQSCQESDKRVSALRNSPLAMRMALESDDPKMMLLALKASSIW